MTKYLLNLLNLKHYLHTLRMTESTPIQNHLDELNRIILDLKNIDVKIEVNNHAPIIVMFSNKHFIDTMLYEDNTLCES